MNYLEIDLKELKEIQYKIQEEYMELAEQNNAKYDEFTKEFNKIKEKHHTWLKDFYKEHKDDLKDEDKRLKSIEKEKNYSDKYREDNLPIEYLNGYQRICAISADEICSDKKYEYLKYPYFLNYCNLFELTIKSLKKFNLIDDKEENIKPTHDLYSIYKNSKENIIKLGLKEEYYNILLDIINDIKSFTNYKDDLAVAFKYPFDKKFKNTIITKKIYSMEYDELKKYVERMMIGVFILMLLFEYGCKKNTEQIANWNKYFEIDILKHQQELIDKYNN